MVTDNAGIKSKSNINGIGEELADHGNIAIAHHAHLDMQPGELCEANF